MITNGYILVKDKEGKMKYFKDGKYYSPDEIRNAAKAQSSRARAVEQKKDLQPIYSFDAVKKTAPAAPLKFAATPVEPKSPPAPAEKVRIDLGDVDELGLTDFKKVRPGPVRPKVNRPIARAEVELEEVAPHAEWQQKRAGDQKLVEEMVNNVIQRLKIKFSDAAIENRFRGVLTTYFRGVRQAKEVSYLLGLPKLSGGLELPKDKIAIIITVLEQAAQDFYKARRDAAAKPFDVSMLKKAEEVEHQLTAPMPVKIEPQSVPEKIISAISPPPTTGAVRDLNNKMQTTRFTTRPEVERPQPVDKPDDSAKQARPRIRDIKVDRRLVGPVEELEIMDLTNFRQLGKTTDEMWAQLRKKFDFLAEQSIIKKVEGAQAWKRSPVFRLYVAMTYDGLRERKPITEVIRARQIANAECLTLSEYEMIGKFNAEIAL